MPTSKRIIIVCQDPRHGVLTLLQKLKQGLEREGFVVNILNTKRRNVPTALFEDLRNLRSLRNYDIVIYSGTTYLSQFFLRSNKKLAIIHGRLIDEISYGILRVTHPLAKLSNFISLLVWLAARSLPFPIICHSNADAAGSFIPSRREVILLPQFVLPNEVAAFEKFRKNAESSNEIPNPQLRESGCDIVAYTSAAPVAKLMPLQLMIDFMHKLNMRTGFPVNLFVFGSAGSGLTSERPNVKIMGFVSPLSFLQAVSQCDIYLESDVYEELRFSTIEAIMLRRPIAKMTLPSRVRHIEIPPGLIISASTEDELIDKVGEFLNLEPSLRSAYACRLHSWLIQHRDWDTVKKELLASLYG